MAVTLRSSPFRYSSSRMFKALPTLGLLLFVCLPAELAGQGGPEVQVPTGPPIVMDGTIEEAEWRGAARFDMDGGGEVMLRLQGGNLLVGVRGAGPGFPHVALSFGDSIWVLHASGALGSITYARDHGEVWEMGRGPVWEMRDTTMSPAAREAREAYFGLHGWVASTGRMGAPGEAEFIILLDRFGGEESRIGVACLVIPPEDAPPRWPGGDPDDLNHQELLGGHTPGELHFRPSGWAGLILK